MFQPAGALKEVPLGCILAYVEDMNRGPNAEIGPIDIFNTLGHTRQVMMQLKKGMQLVIVHSLQEGVDIVRPLSEY